MTTTPFKNDNFIPTQEAKTSTTNRFQKKIPLKDRSLAAINPDLAAEWHPTKNNGLTAWDVTPFSHKSAWWQCEKGHDWRAAIFNRTRGSNCPYCSRKRSYPGETDLKTLCPELAKQWHPTANGILRPEHVAPSSLKKVWWLCDKGHEWRAAIGGRNRDGICPFCSGRRPYPGETDLETLCPNLAKQWHPTLNGDLRPSDVAVHSDKHVWWICDKGHEWRAAISNRAKGVNCPVCAGKRISKNSLIYVRYP